MTPGAGSGRANLKANTGEVNLLSAAEPEEAGLPEDLRRQDQRRTPTTRRDRGVGRLRGAVPDPGRRRHARRRRCAAAGSHPGLVARPGTSSRSRTSGSTSTSSTTLFGDSFLSLGEYNGKHYGLPTNINLKSMVWYPKAAFDAAGYTVPEDLGRAARAQRPDRGRRQHAVVRRLRERRRHRVAGDRLDGRHHAPHGGAGHLRPVGQPRDPVQRPGRATPARCSATSCSTTATSSAARRDTPTIAFGDAPLPMFENPPECWLHRQASFINAFFPEGTEAGVDYDWFPLPPIDQEGTLFAGELTVVGTNGNRPEVVGLPQPVHRPRRCSARWAASTASSRISPNVNVGPDCYVNTILADASVVLTDALEAGTGRFDASDLMPAEVGSGQLLDRDGRVHEERPGLPVGCPRRHRGELAGSVDGPAHGPSRR